MAIFVDYPMPIKGKFRNYCHMWTDGTHEELDNFAVGTLGLKKEWAQHKQGAIVKDFYHYDISPSKRQRAIKWGARPIALSTWITQYAKAHGLR